MRPRAGALGPHPMCTSDPQLLDFDDIYER